jgi:mono/diheme cytochrome c family protein
MKTLVLASIALALVSAAMGPAKAQEPKADPATAGRDVALKICANCHIVAEGQESAPLLKPPAPNFSAIAMRPGTTEKSLRNFLANPHGEVRRSSKMPGFALADFQIKEVVAYILSLRGNQERPE